MISGVYTSARSSSQVMGISTNVGTLGPRIQENSPAPLMPNTTNARAKSVTLPLSALSSPQTVCLATPSPTLAATPCRVSVSHGVAGATSVARASVSAPPQIRAIILRMPSFGSSPVESLMGRVTLLLLVMILSVGWRMRLSLLHRRGTGMKRILRCCSRILFQHLFNLCIYSLHL
jgi:hypothetical protein